MCFTVVPADPSMRCHDGHALGLNAMEADHNAMEADRNAMEADRNAMKLDIHCVRTQWNWGFSALRRGWVGAARAS